MDHLLTGRQYNDFDA